MRKRLVLIGLLAVVIGVSATLESGADGRLTPLPVTVTTKDSSIICADLYLPADTTKTGFPLVMLLHMFNHDRSSYKDLVPQLVARNWAVLNVDLRGHGESAFVRRKITEPKKLRAADFRMMPGDLMQLLGVVRQKTTEVDLSQLGIIGASVGSSVAVVFGAKHPEVKALVLLSPGLEYKKINVEPYLVEYGRRPVLLMVGKYDTFPYLSTRTLDSVALGEKRLQIYENPKHGTNLFDVEPAADSLIVEWLDDYL